MTVQEALALYRDSVPWKNSGADERVAWKLFAQSNPGEADKILHFAETGLNRPTLVTKYGRAMVEFVSREMYAVIPAFYIDAPPPPPPPSAGAPWHHAEAIAAPGGLASLPYLQLHAAGFRRFSCTLSDGDPMTPGNIAEFPKVAAILKPKGALMGGFFVMRGDDVEAQAEAAVARAGSLHADYLKFDVEDYKADTVTPLVPDGRAVADRFGRLVAKMKTFPQWNAVSSFITFGDTGGDTPLCSPMPDGKPVVDFTPASAAGWHGDFEAYSETGVPRSVSQAVKLSTACYDKNRAHVSIGSQDVAAQVAVVLSHVKAGKIALGFSVWDAPNLSQPEIDALASAILNGAAVS